MTYEQWLRQATTKLAKKDIATARLDTLLLLEYILCKERTNILAHPEQIIAAEALVKLDILLKKRLAGEPMAYILGQKEFYGNVFVTTPAVLIPRPESEAFIDLLKIYLPLFGTQSLRLIDVGTGSGCLAITAKLQAPKIEVNACDISQAALKIAKLNANKLVADVNIFESDLLHNASGKFNIVFANLPYVPLNYSVSPDVNAEPRLALYAGLDGLDIIKEFLLQCPAKLTPNGLVFIESLELQHETIEILATKQKLKLVETKNLVQVFQI